MLKGDETKDSVIPYTGSVSITIKLDNKTDLIVLHAKELNVTQVNG